LKSLPPRVDWGSLGGTYSQKKILNILKQFYGSLKAPEIDNFSPNMVKYGIFDMHNLSFYFIKNYVALV